MKIAEFFVNLGVKGSDKTQNALKGVKTGLGEAKSMAFETKAMIAAVVYGLEKLMSQSAQAGTGLLNFATLTGISAKNLQEWQYAARQAGVSGDELAGNLKAVQNSMTNMLLGKGAPEGMAMVANKVGFDVTKARDTLYVMQQLQKFAQAVPKDVGNQMLKSFGVSEGTIAAMRRNAFRPEVFAKAPMYGDKEIAQLNKVDVAWSNLGQKIQMAFGHFTSKHGMQLVADLEKITSAVIRLADGLTVMAEKFKVFEGLSKTVGFLADAAEAKPGTLMGEKHLEKKFFDWIMKPLSNADATSSLGTPVAPGVYAPPPVKPVDKNSGGTQNIEVNQTLQFQHDGKDAKKTGQSVNKAVRDAYRQMSAQAQGS